MAATTMEQRAKLVSEINAMWPGAAYAKDNAVVVTLRHPGTGTSATWLSDVAPTIPTATEILDALKAKLGIAAKSARSAMAAEKART